MPYNWDEQLWVNQLWYLIRGFCDEIDECYKLVKESSHSLWNSPSWSVYQKASTARNVSPIEWYDKRSWAASRHQFHATYTNTNPHSMDGHRVSRPFSVNDYQINRSTMRILVRARHLRTLIHQWLLVLRTILPAHRSVSDLGFCTNILLSDLTTLWNSEHSTQPT